MFKNPFLAFTLKCFVIAVLLPGNASAGCAASDQILTFSDPALLIQTTLFADGMPVYFTASDGVTTGGTNPATVSNGDESISTTLYDDGTYPDQTANDGVYTAHFRVSTIMTIDVPSRPSQPKIVGCIYLAEGQSATIQVDLNGNGDAAAKQVQLATLFEVSAVAKDTSAVVVWTTSIPATSQVEYGTSTSYGSLSAVDTTPRLHHRVFLDGLTPGITYHYQVLSQDIYGNARVSEDRTLVTKTPAELEAAIKAARADGGLPHTYYVKPDGDDGNDGLTTTTAWRHVAYAVQQADAGDTLYVLEGAYPDEHVVFPKSGLDIAPIRLLAYSGKPVLDGVDGSGMAIRLQGRSHVEIAGLRLVNYAIGIRGENLLQYLYLHGFESGLTFWKAFAAALHLAIYHPPRGNVAGVLALVFSQCQLFCPGCHIKVAQGVYRV